LFKGIPIWTGFTHFFGQPPQHFCSPGQEWSFMHCATQYPVWSGASLGHLPGLSFGG